MEEITQKKMKVIIWLVIAGVVLIIFGGPILKLATWIFKLLFSAACVLILLRISKVPSLSALGIPIWILGGYLFWELAGVLLKVFGILFWILMPFLLAFLIYKILERYFPNLFSKVFKKDS